MTNLQHQIVGLNLPLRTLFLSGSCVPPESFPKRAMWVSPNREHDLLWTTSSSLSATHHVVCFLRFFGHQRSSPHIIGEFPTLNEDPLPSRFDRGDLPLILGQCSHYG